MDCRFLASLLLAAQAASPVAAANRTVDCSVPATDGAVDTAPIRSRADLDAWLTHCPSPLDLMAPGARGRFLGSLGFNERGVTQLPTADLSAELTGDEIAEIFALLDVRTAGRPTGLTPEEARKLRTARETHGHERGASDTELRYNALYYAHQGARFESDEEFIAFITNLYDALFPVDGRHDAIEEASDYDLRLRYGAAGLISTIGYRTDHIEAAGAALAELESRDLATRGDLSAMHKALIHAGQIDESRRFAHRHAAAGLEPLPPLREATPVGDGEPSVLRLSPSADALLHEAVALEPVRIVVVASYACGFSQAAARAIPEDPELGPIFREHAVWLAAPTHLDNLHALQRWNDANPESALAIAASLERWPMLNFDNVPQFHVFRDGELVASVTSGWPLEEGNRDAVLAALRKAGLADDP